MSQADETQEDNERGTLTEARKALGKAPAAPPRANKVDKEGKTVASVIEIPTLEEAYLETVIIGDSPLLVHAWSRKAINEMLQKQMKPKKAKGGVKAKTEREAKDPFKDFLGSLYPHPQGGYGFPSNAIKKACVSACSFVEGVKIREARSSFTILGDLVQIHGTPTPRMDPVNVGHGSPKGPVADIRFRGEFLEWTATLHINYLPQLISRASIIGLLNNAGRLIGIGEWRITKDGHHGAFHVMRDGNADDKAIVDRCKPADRAKVAADSSGMDAILADVRDAGGEGLVSGGDEAEDS
jgi:hypothetical protein